MLSRSRLADSRHSDPRQIGFSRIVCGKNSTNRACELFWCTIRRPVEGDHAKKDLMAELANAGHHAIYESTRKSDYKKALKKPTDLVLAAGGDGTVGKIGRELIGTGIPLSVLPLGTANNLARSLGFIGSPEEIIYRARRREKTSFWRRSGTRAVGQALLFLKAPEVASSRIIFGRRRTNLRKRKTFPKNKKWDDTFHSCAECCMTIPPGNGRWTSTAKTFRMVTFFGRRWTFARSGLCCISHRRPRQRMGG